MSTGDEFTMVRRGERTLVLDGRGETYAGFADSGYGSREAAEAAAATYCNSMNGRRRLELQMLMRRRNRGARR